MGPVQRDLARIQAEDRKAVTHALERAYPLAKDLAEILELELIEPEATEAKRLRQRIAERMAHR